METIYSFPHPHPHTHTHTSTLTSTPTHTPTHTLTHTHTHSPTHTHTPPHTLTHTHPHLHTHSPTPPHTLTHTPPHSPTHTHPHRCCPPSCIHSYTHHSPRAPLQSSSADKRYDTLCMCVYHTILGYAQHALFMKIESLQWRIQETEKGGLKLSSAKREIFGVTPTSSAVKLGEVPSKLAWHCC